MARPDHDPALIERIKLYILAYRRDGGPAARTQEATLANFGAATSADFALGLVAANRAQKAAWEEAGK
jgi:hypothetical protein